ncbi:MAG: alpha/beta hydrolase [Pseudomonadota bacterium]
MERMLRANGIDICCEVFGKPTDPAVLLIAELGQQGVGGPSRLCQRLATAGRHVVRYDARDTGRSTSFDFDRRPYTLADMADDAVGVLDALNIPAAHIVGCSTGGMVAQEIAIGHPQRVRTLASLMSTPSVIDPASPTGYTGGLPAAAPQVQDLWAAREHRPAVTRDEHIAAALRYRRLVATAGSFSERAERSEQARQFDRARDIAAAAHHDLAIVASEDRTARLAAIAVPSLVVHGSADPVLPYPHGIAIASAISGARLLMLDGLAHSLPETGALADCILHALIAHTARDMPMPKMKPIKFF